MVKISKQAIETAKTITIVVLITSATAFVAGMRYQSATNQAVEQKLQHAVTTATSKNQ